MMNIYFIFTIKYIEVIFSQKVLYIIFYDFFVDFFCWIFTGRVTYTAPTISFAFRDVGIEQS